MSNMEVQRLLTVARAYLESFDPLVKQAIEVLFECLEEAMAHPPEQPAADLFKFLSVWDQTIGCDKCGRAWWGDENTDDPTLFHESDCPLFGRRDVADSQYGFNVEYIEKELGRRLGVESNTVEGWRKLTALYVKLHRDEVNAHYSSLAKLFEVLGKKIHDVEDDKEMDTLVEMVTKLKEGAK